MDDAGGVAPARIARPGEFCRMLLAALEASEGRRRRRRRDTTPDAIGLGIKRRLLEEAVGADPDPVGFEAWLLATCLNLGAQTRAGTAGAGVPAGPALAMASEILADWRLVQRSDGFREWLERGAVSDDRTER